MKRLFGGALLALFVLGVQAQINFSGDVQYRFRYEWNVLHAISDSTRGDYTNRYAWNLKGTYIKDNLLFDIRLSNPMGSATDNIADNLSYVTQGNYNLVSVPNSISSGRSKNSPCRRVLFLFKKIRCLTSSCMKT